MNKNYKRGRDTEYRIMNDLKKEGYQLIVRSAGSHSKIDVTGYKDNKIKMIQSKRSKTKYVYLSYFKEDIEIIQSLYKNNTIPTNAEVELWIWIDRKGFKKWRITEKEVIEIG